MTAWRQRPSGRHFCLPHAESSELATQCTRHSFCVEGIRPRVRTSRVLFGRRIVSLSREVTRVDLAAALSVGVKPRGHGMTAVTRARRRARSIKLWGAQRGCTWSTLTPWAATPVDVAVLFSALTRVGPAQLSVSWNFDTFPGHRLA